MWYNITGVSRSPVHNVTGAQEIHCDDDHDDIHDKWQRYYLSLYLRRHHVQYGTNPSCYRDQRKAPTHHDVDSPRGVLQMGGPGQWYGSLGPLHAVNNACQSAMYRYRVTLPLKDVKIDHTTWPAEPSLLLSDQRQSQAQMQFRNNRHMKPAISIATASDQNVKWLNATATVHYYIQSDDRLQTATTSLQINTVKRFEQSKIVVA